MMQLVFTDIRPVRARRTDPATSHAAAKRAEHFADTHKGRILAALREHGPMGAHEMQQWTGLTVVQIDRRINELRDAGQIAACSVDGKQLERFGCSVWMVA